MTQPVTAIVIVNYCSAGPVESCVSSIERLSYPQHTTIVIDNASPDGSGRALRARLHNVEVILNPENRGFAAGVNTGISKARALGARYIWLLNPDTTVESDSLSALVHAAEEHPQGALFGSKVLWGGGVPGERKIWGFGGSFDAAAEQVRMLAHNEPDDDRWADVREVEYVPGCSLLVRASVLPQLGPMPEEFFMYYEETSWCSAARSAGYAVFAVPDSVVYHHFDEEKLRRPFTVYYFNRNDRLFWFRRRSAWGKLRMVARVALKELPQALNALRHSPPEQRDLFRAHAASRIDFLLGRFGRRYLP